jgi:hypothetical protein
MPKYAATIHLKFAPWSAKWRYTAVPSNNAKHTIANILCILKIDNVEIRLYVVAKTTINTVCHVAKFPDDAAIIKLAFVYKRLAQSAAKIIFNAIFAFN